MRVHTPFAVEHGGHARLGEIERRGESNSVRLGWGNVSVRARTLGKEDDAVANGIFSEADWTTKRPFDDEPIFRSFDRRDEPSFLMRVDASKNVDERDEHVGV